MISQSVLKLAMHRVLSTLCSPLMPGIAGHELNFFTPHLSKILLTQNLFSFMALMPVRKISRLFGRSMTSS